MNRNGRDLTLIRTDKHQHKRKRNEQTNNHNSNQENRGRVKRTKSTDHSQQGQGHQGHTSGNNKQKKNIITFLDVNCIQGSTRIREKDQSSSGPSSTSSSSQIEAFFKERKKPKMEGKSPSSTRKRTFEENSRIVWGTEEANNRLSPTRVNKVMPQIIKSLERKTNLRQERHILNQQATHNDDQLPEIGGRINNLLEFLTQKRTILKNNDHHVLKSPPRQPCPPQVPLTTIKQQLFNSQTFEDESKQVNHDLTFAPDLSSTTYNFEDDYLFDDDDLEYAAILNKMDKSNNQNAYTAIKDTKELNKSRQETVDPNNIKDCSNDSLLLDDGDDDWLSKLSEDLLTKAAFVQVEPDGIVSRKSFEQEINLNEESNQLIVNNEFKDEFDHLLDDGDDELEDDNLTFNEVLNALNSSASHTSDVNIEDEFSWDMEGDQILSQIKF